MRRGEATLRRGRRWREGSHPRDTLECQEWKTGEIRSEETRRSRAGTCGIRTCPGASGWGLWTRQRQQQNLLKVNICCQENWSSAVGTGGQLSQRRAGPSSKHATLPWLMDAVGTLGPPAGSCVPKSHTLISPQSRVGICWEPMGGRCLIVTPRLNVQKWQLAVAHAALGASDTATDCNSCALSAVGSQPPKPPALWQRL